MVARKVAMFTLFALLSAGFSGCEDDNWDRAKVEESRKIGDEIISAAARYHADKDTVPTGLKELVPQYLPAITPSTGGRAQWSYRRDGQHEFFLGFAANNERGYPCCRFVWKNGEGQWYEDH